MTTAKNNPWAICRAQAGNDSSKFESCVAAVKAKLGLHKDMTEDQYLTIMQFGEIEAEIFEEGNHGGQDWTKADLELIKKNFDEFGRELIQPPMVLGHDEKQPLLKNSGLPAAGWLKSIATKIKASGKMSLIGKFSDVPELIRQAVQKRLYKRISSEIYQDFSNPNLDGGKSKGFTLRRVALMGADIPEVKTLADVVAFGEGPDKLLYAEHEGENQMDQAQIEKLIADGIAKDRAENEKKFKAFEEQQATLKSENEQLKKDNQSMAASHAASLLERRSGAISSFIEVQKAQGKILPAWEAMGLKRFMEALDDKKVVKFGEGDKAVEQSPLAFFQEFLKGLPKVVRLSEMSETDFERIQKDKAGSKASDKMNASLDAAVKKFMEDEKKTGNKTITYAEALREVSIASPELVNHLRE